MKKITDRIYPTILEPIDHSKSTDFWGKENDVDIKYLDALDDGMDMLYISVSQWNDLLKKANIFGFADSMMKIFEDRTEFPIFLNKKMLLIVDDGGTIFIESSNYGFYAQEWKNGIPIFKCFSNIQKWPDFPCWGRGNWVRENVTTLKSQLLTITYVLQYFEYDEVSLNPHSTGKAFHCKYQNKTSNEIKVIDVNWNRNLEIINQIQVRGFLRNQAVGKNREDRRITWVTPHTRKYKRQSEVSKRQTS